MSKSEAVPESARLRDESAEPPVAVSEERKTQILHDLSSGAVSLMRATTQLGLPDAGWTLKLLADAGLPLFALDSAEVRRQCDLARDALHACLRPEVRVALEAQANSVKS